MVYTPMEPGLIPSQSGGHDTLVTNLKRDGWRLAV